MYYDMLESTHIGDLDVTKWLVWFLECLMHSMEQTDETIAKAIARALFWENQKETVFNIR